MNSQQTTSQNLTVADASNLRILGSAGARTRGRFEEFFRSPGTRRAYAAPVFDFLTWCENSGITALHQIRQSTVNAFIKQMEAPPHESKHALIGIQKMITYSLKGNLHAVVIHEAGHQAALWVLRRTLCDINVQQDRRPGLYSAGSIPRPTAEENIRCQEFWGLKAPYDMPNAANLDNIRADSALAGSWLREQVIILSAGGAAERLFGYEARSAGQVGDRKDISSLLRIAKRTNLTSSMKSLHAELTQRSEHLVKMNGNMIAALADSLLNGKQSLGPEFYSINSDSVRTILEQHEQAEEHVPIAKVQ